MLLFSVSVWGQVSPDYIFGDDNGAGWNWTAGTVGTASAGNSYLWQYNATAIGSHFVKFGESATNADGDGFWVNSAGTDMNYTGAGAKWTAYYQANMGSGGAIYWPIVTGNYYVVKTKLNGANADFAVFDNGAVAPVTISSVARVIAGTDLTVTATASAVASANEKVWVRYSLDNWTSSTTTELVNVPTTTTYAATLSLLDGDFISYYVYTTIQQVAAPAEADADFFTIAYNNNGGVNYTAQIGTLSGDYYIPQNGNAKGYNLLSTAVTNLNANGMSANVNFYITGNITEPANIGLGVNTGGFNLTIKPNTGITPTITFTDGTTSQNIDGHFVIGSPTFANTNLIPTNNVIIDGSNIVDGTTKDLTINGPATALQRSVFRIFGNNDYITIKNCIINDFSSSSSSHSPLNITDYTNLAPDFLTIENNTLTAISGNGGLGVYLSNSGTVTIGMTNITIKDNTITHRGTRGIMCNYVSDANIYGNSISANLQLGSGAGAGIYLTTGTTPAGTFNIYNNQFSNLQFLNNTAAASNGYIAIDNTLATPKIVNINNNFITGFVTIAAVSNSKIYGIRHTSTSTSNIYNNTIVLPEMTNMTTFGSSYIAGIVFATAATTEASPTGTINIKNNIIISNETTMKTWGIRRVGTGGTFTSNKNDIYYDESNLLGYSGYWNNADQQTLLNWQSASSQDANSKSKAVNFVDVATGDLHLAGGSLGDTDLIAEVLATVTTDIDGETRSLTFPYMGADENLANLLPVELTKFDATLVDDGVMLYWSTATEVNNYGFEVEVSTDGENWENVGFVEGHGNSNSQQDYNFLYTEPFNNKVNSRLKQVDTDGGFEYSEVVSVLSGEASFKLNQNYPNPFNPTTIISFSLKASAKVTLKVYNALGQEVAVLANNIMDAGFHEVDFDASNLASGVYIYRLDAPGYSKTMKMMLIK